MKALRFLILFAVGGVLLWGVTQLPPRGDADHPIHRARTGAGDTVASTYYIENAYKDAETPNMVTVVLADYRGYDTLGETVVVFTAGLACYLILRRRRI